MYKPVVYKKKNIDIESVEDLISENYAGRLSEAFNQQALYTTRQERDDCSRTNVCSLVNNALNQLKLYYLVGSEGWGTAINTIKTAEATRSGIPEPKHEVKPQIIYVNLKPNNQANLSNNAYGKKQYGRRPYKKN